MIVEHCKSSCPANAAAGHDQLGGVHLFLMVSTTWVDLRSVAFLTVVNRPVFALRPTLNDFDFICSAFDSALRAGGALIAPPVDLGRVLFRDQNRPRPQAKRFRVKPGAGLRACPPRAENIPVARRRGCVTLGHYTLHFGAYLAFVPRLRYEQSCVGD